MLDPSVLAEYNAIRTTKDETIFCHSPFTSMNFEQSGQVTVCCYNRTYLLGRYPRDSLARIWFSDAAERLREKMRGNELPAGCGICLDQFHSRNFEGLRARFYDSLAESPYPWIDGHFSAMPKVMEFEISNTCNLECQMCNGSFSSSIRRNREKLPPIENPYDEAFVEQLEPFIPHLQKARFLGGEPFMIKPYFGIWERISRKNPSLEVSITTNGTILTERVKRLLDRLNATIILSIDSIERATYERIRVNASYARVMANLRYFQASARERDTCVHFAVCPMQQNWPELPNMLEYCNANGIRLFLNTVVHPAHAALSAMTHEELQHVVEHLRRANVPESSDTERHNAPVYCDLIKQVERYRDTKAGYSGFENVDLSRGSPPVSG